ncbi:methyltransferase domain-containing protein [Aminobacter aminovorans]|uniref:methyltransferase domain-containing protein n=1 Tax=Aminobacter aminovorans TaxID=83263 RepID=UPI002859947F|nr:methyltransferase domain-containing protein [Aminobacter aminovorans]MDR7222763.1 SAM-dependent methyltransferase [Aminobacter aminovorans]
MNQRSPVYSRAGYCSICEAATNFVAQYDWYRDHLNCAQCGSIPRERALALVLSRHFPNWRTLAIHESSPGPRGISPKLQRDCAGYVASQFFPDKPLGKQINGFRNENLELQTFADESFDLVVTLDVMEHVNQPADVLCEVARTLKPGGVFLFTVPTYKERVASERRALYRPDGTVDHYAEPEYHGNPISDAGSLVTFHYGYDLAELIYKWSGMDVQVVRFHDHRHGIIGDFTEVYLATKPFAHSKEETGTPIVDHTWPAELRAICEDVSRALNVPPEVHGKDDTFRFLHDHPGFPTKNEAIDYYFKDGARSAAKVRRIVDEWVPAGVPLTILEFAAGFGAVTRHAVAALVPHILHSSNVDAQANDFLSSVFGVQSVQSTHVPEELLLPTEYDVIFALSFFSHRPRSTWGRWLQRLYAGLQPGGVLLFTTHGTTSMRYFPQAMLDGTGFWFDQSSEQGDLEVAKYGQTITSKEFVDGQIAQLSGAEYLTYEPAGWWEHQDLYVVRKPSAAAHVGNQMKAAGD